MSRQNVEFLRLGYEALHRGDTEAFEAMSRERLDPDFTFHSHWAGRVFRGIAGTQEWMSDVRETWDDYDQEIEDIVDLGDDVLVVGRASARGAGSGVPVTQEFAVVWTFEGERAVRARSFPSRAEAEQTVEIGK
ncbi:MAG TPA: nuclear transport factor 2 family protein [Thermoleophilaceae bacterium]|jgi:ketosteroid isomerase-like protein